MDGRKFSTIEAGGRILSLRLSFNAMVEANREVGSIDAFGTRPFETFRAVIWASANEAVPGTLTIRAAGDFCEDYVAENGEASIQAKVDELMIGSGWLKKAAAAQDEPGKNGKGQSKK